MTTKRLRVTILAIALIALAVGSISAQKGYDLFQQALAKERAEGKPLEAIALYQQVIKDAGSDRALIAKALVQMAGCYERVGSPEARKTYERVVNEFADQTEMVTVARAKLTFTAVGAGDKSATFSPFIEPIARHVTLPDGALVSPDGRLVASLESNGRDLVVRDLAVGPTVRLASGAAGEHVGVPFAWSRDSRRLAVNLCKGGAKNPCDLRVIAADGSEQRTILPMRTGIEVLQGTAGIDVLDWSPDDRQVMAVLWSSPTPSKAQLVLVSVTDGAIRELKTADYNVLQYPTRFSAPAFSADGRYVAYTLAGDVVIVPTDGSGEHPLIQHPASERFVGWTPSGRSILFLSDRLGTTDLWLVEVNDGRVASFPQRVKRDIGNIQGASVTADGALYYSLAASNAVDVYLATLDSVTGHVVSPPALVAQSNFGHNRVPVWSPDGRSLAYASGPPEPAPPIDGDQIAAPWNVITIVSVDTGEQRQIRPRMDGGIPGLIAWAPDGRSFLVSGGLGPGPRASGLFKVDAATGETTILVSKPLDRRIAEGRWLPDGRSVVFISVAAAGPTGEAVVIRNIQSGEERVIYDGKAVGLEPGGLALSPDGTSVAFRTFDTKLKTGAVVVVGLADGRFRQVTSHRAGFPALMGPIAPTLMGCIAWTPNGRYLLFPGLVDPNDSLGARELWRVPVAGGQPEKLGLTMDALGVPTLSRDGRHLAFQAFQKTPAGTFVLEHFLPASELRHAPDGVRRNQG
jgi:Tol biopolymer transport system component